MSLSPQDDPVAQSIREVYPYEVDLGNCDVEPLSRIQVVQPFACFLGVTTDDMLVRYVSDNASTFVGREWRELLNEPLGTVFGTDVMGQITLGLQREEGFETLNPIRAFVGNGRTRQLKNLIVHLLDGLLLIEVEEPSTAIDSTVYQRILSTAIQRIQNIREYKDLFRDTALILRQLTGYDRVMVYRFDGKYNGEVIAEALREGLEPFHGLRYPHTDIPRQARDLYLKNRIRLITDVNSTPSRIHAAEGWSTNRLDLTQVGSRGVSPVHLEYLGYMGVNNSLSVAIVMEGKLWGLFAMHHYLPKQVDYLMRNTLLLIGQMFSGHLSLQSASRYREQTLTRNLTRLAIADQIGKSKDVFEGLTTGAYTITNIFPGTNGALIQVDNRRQSYGLCPDKEDVDGLIDWINETGVEQNDLIYFNSSVGLDYPPFGKYCETAAGVLVIFLSPDFTDYVCWFRPGITQTITWGGKPEKETVVQFDGTQRLGPRRSFARYVETIEGCSAEWSESEVDTALAFRITILNSLMQRYAEVQQVNEQLQKAYEDLETFSYTVSHDLRAPLRAINGYTELLAEEIEASLTPDTSELIDGIQRGVEQMNSFITDILELSRVGSGGMHLQAIDPTPLVQEVMRELRNIYQRDAMIDIRIEERLPDVRADKRLLRQLFTNIISNALKYVQPDEAGQSVIEVGSYTTEESSPVIFVSNSGPAIPEEYTKTIFEMFSRLSTRSEAEGTGVGLAIVQRIIDRHDGRVWVTNDRHGVTFNVIVHQERNEP
jgi:light-regulated signal transduction histidine kinase (bacteriophytochrome)